MVIKQLLSTAFHYLGTPYVYNSQPHQSKSFDCSSFIQYIFYVNGVRLPRNSRQQFLIGKAIPFHKIQKGDLLFFTTSKRRNSIGINKIGHVGLYIGNNKMIHTYHDGKKVTISDLRLYWKSVFVGAKRIV
ncbi:C40 family peptidase [Neobacillus pocheonensis]|uniref:C40 family peptidase n=1 Tax=Neobacillus pocheonensis TaxID=363869 RepID=A0ABT0WLJ9_9BACI|nr:C40 family peptidase [Neobacillus pocheonensis]